MRNKAGKRKRGKVAVVAAVCAAVLLAVAVWGGLRLLRNATTTEHLETLKRLNDEWTPPEEYTVEVVKTGELRMEWAWSTKEKPDRAILQLHGGSYTRSLEESGATYRRAAAQYARISGAAVLTPDYRVAPDHPYPAALEDALAAYEWLLAQGYDAGSIIVAGDSAGGGLALALTLYLRDNSLALPAGVVTMSAWTDLNYRRYTPAYVGENPADTPYISPVYGAYAGCPPMLMQVGGKEALLRDTLDVAQKAGEAGVFVTQTTYPDMFHVFQMLFPVLPQANEAWEEVKAFIDERFMR